MAFSLDPNVTGRDVDQIICKRLCAECWGELFFDPDAHAVTCHTPGCACSSSVSKATVRIREDQDQASFRRARSAMAEALGLPVRQAPKSVDACLRDLGF